jgi:hypothetical protein
VWCLASVSAQSLRTALGAGSVYVAECDVERAAVLVQARSVVVVGFLQSFERDQNIAGCIIRPHFEIVFAREYVWKTTDPQPLCIS